MINANEKIEMLETFLFNAIITLYDDSFIDYCGLDDEDFVKRVCEITRMSESDYEDLILNRNEDIF